ncbi:MAG: hypothetical protein RSG92_27890, partial [Pseudomonas sp.]
ARTNLGVDKLSQQSNGTFLQSPNTLHSLFLYNGGEWGCIDSVTAAPRVLGIPFGGTSGLMSIYDTIATFISAPTNKDLNLFVRDSSTAGKLWGCFDVSTQTHIPLGIGQGGTGKSTAAEARVALNAVGVGDYGVGTSSSNNYAPGVGCGFYGLADNDVPTPGIGCTAVHLQTLGYAIDIASPLAGPSRIFTRNQQSSSWSEHYCTANTTVDVNGFIKKASPIVKLKGDGTAVLNEYAEGVTVKRISIGVYKISGVLGFNSSTEW